MVELDVQTLALVSGLVIPILVGIVTKKVASAAVKAWCNAVLSAAAGAVAVAISASGSVNLRDWISSAVIAWATSMATYYGFWKPTGIAPAVQDATAGIGIGSGDDRVMKNGLSYEELQRIPRANPRTAGIGDPPLGEEYALDPVPVPGDPAPIKGDMFPTRDELLSKTRGELVSLADGLGVTVGSRDAKPKIIDAIESALQRAE